MSIAFLLFYLLTAGLFFYNQTLNRDVDVQCGMDRVVFFGPNGNDTRINQQEYLENLRNQNKFCYFYAGYIEVIVVFIFMGPFFILGPWGIFLAPVNLLIFPLVGYALGKYLSKNQNKSRS
jgi:hypothetical protein